MIELNYKTKEVDIQLTYKKTIGEKHRVVILSEGDMLHHLIEGLFEIIERLAKMENCCHRAKEYRRGK